MATETTIMTEPIIRIRRWSSERPLFILVILAASACWILLAVSMIGFLYAAFLGLFFFFSHVAFITYLRGSAVRLGPEQMPELFERVQLLSAQVGLAKAPDTYVMQAGGSLNALATKLFSANFIVLFSDLLDACGENTEARDMIIAHELGHLKAGHLRGLWFLLPGMFIPFLGGAYSRAREYTADRYGFGVIGNRDQAMLGMSILAAGGKYGPKVNLRVLANQRNDLNSTWMTIGRWLSSHPPIADRIAAVDPTIAPTAIGRASGALGAIFVMACIFILPTVLATQFGPRMMAALKKASPQAQSSAIQPASERSVMPADQVPAATERAEGDLRNVEAVVKEYQAQTGALPEDSAALYAAWKLLRPGKDVPVDPFDGYPYGYEINGTEYVLWSSGPDLEDETDNLTIRSTPGVKGVKAAVD